MTKILVVGCSMTKGHGLSLEKDDPKLWVTQLIKSNFNNTTIVNLAQTGRNNHWIFTETASAIIKDNYNVVVVGWSSLERLNFNVGLELYSTTTMLKNLDVNVNSGMTIKGKTLEKLGDELQKIKNPHWDILDLIKYVNILYYIQVATKKSKLFFVNTLTDFPDEYFQRMDFSVPSGLDSYTQELLSVEARDDQEIKKLYNRIHDQYTQYGGIHTECWLNLNKSLDAMKIDTISNTDTHPGYLSQDVFAEYLTPILREKL